MLLVAATVGWALAVVVWALAGIGIVMGFGSWGGHRLRHGFEAAVLSWLSFPVVVLVACAAAWVLWSLSVPWAGYVLLVPFANGIVYLAVLATAYDLNHPAVAGPARIAVPQPVVRYLPEPVPAVPAPRTRWPDWAPVPTLAEAERALRTWQRWAIVHRPSYVDTVVGGRHDVEIDLPADALACVRRGRRDPDVTARYAEPMCALRDGDWELPPEIELAYADVHNLYASFDSPEPAPPPTCDDARVDLRPELCPPPVDRARVAELSAEIERIDRLVHEGGGPDDPAVAAAVDRFNDSTGRAYTPWDLMSEFREVDVAELALDAAWPVCPVVEDVTRDELIEVVRRRELGGEDAGYYDLVLARNLPWLRSRLDATTRRGERDPDNEPRTEAPTDPDAPRTPEQVVDAQLRHRPIAL